MKKFLTVCIICILFVLVVYFFWSNPYVTKKFINPILETIDLHNQIEEEYTSDFVINDLNIKSDEYYYNTLDDNCKIIYKSLANAVKDLENKFYIKDYVFEDIEKTMADVENTLQKFLLDHPEVFYLNDKYFISTSQSVLGDKVEIEISYSVFSKTDLNNKITQIKNSMQNIINTANISIGTDFEKELRLHDVLAKKVKYCEYENINQIPNNAHTIYGAFVENVAVCDGLAKALQILLDKIDIESIVVTGTLDVEAHAWNMIKLENDWYNLDITSNKSIKDDNIVIHSYFNITNNEIKKTHRFDEHKILPNAYSDKFNYFVVQDKLITSSDNFDTRLKSILDNNKDLEKVEYKVKNISDVPEKTIKVLRNGRYYDYIDRSLTKFVYYNILDNYIIIKR